MRNLSIEEDFCGSGMLPEKEPGAGDEPARLLFVVLITVQPVPLSSPALSILNHLERKLLNSVGSSELLGREA